MEKTANKFLKVEQRALSSEQQSKEPAPIVAAEAPTAEPPSRVPESADVVIIGEKQQICPGANSFTVTVCGGFSLHKSCVFLWN
jgi:hypothetical protein